MDALGQRLRAGRLDRRQRSPSSKPESLRRTRSSAAGSPLSLNGAPLRNAPGLKTGA
jgi:hypothetical protein